MRILCFTVITVGMLTLSALASSAESIPPKFAMGIGLEVSSGAFGTGSTSTYATVPLIIDWFPTERLDFELTAPFLYQRTENTGHAALGTTMQSPAGTAAKSVGRGSMGGGSRGSLFGGEYGVGDITLTGGYTLLTDSDCSPLFRSTLYVKFPTADESRGLGTGKFDFGSGAIVAKWLGRWQPYTEGRYVVQGASHDGSGAENFVTADTGVAYGWSDNLTSSGSVRYGSKLFESMAAPLEARVKLVWRFSDKMYTDIFALKGLSSGSPDYGGSASVFMEF